MKRYVIVNRHLGSVLLNNDIRHHWSAFWLTAWDFTAIRHGIAWAYN